jgi:hypothetical protein
MTDGNPTGPGQPSSLHPGVKKEMHYSLNSHQTAACKNLIQGLRKDFALAKSTGKLNAFYKVTLPTAKQAYFKIVKPTDGSGTSFDRPGQPGYKDEYKGKMK